MATRYKNPSAPEAKAYLIEWRETKFSTQQALSNAIGLPAATISRYETGEREWGKGYLEALAFAVKCRVPDLFLPPSEVRKPRRSPEDDLRAAMLAFGVDKDDLGRAVSSVKVFVDDPDEQRSPAPPHDQSAPASPRREVEPSRPRSRQSSS